MALRMVEHLDFGPVALYHKVPACHTTVFNYTCPKFISPAPPDWSAIETFNPNEAHQRQLNLFLTEVQQQAKFPDIRAYMRLYSAMPVPKLSQFLEIEPDALRTLLMCYKYKTRQLVNQGSSVGPLDGMS